VKRYLVVIAMLLLATLAVCQPCTKNIAFAVAGNGQITAPAYATKWVQKNQKKYSTVCFSQTPMNDVENYLLVFANSQSAYYGAYPTTQTSTSTTPVYGSGTATSNYGHTWNYTYSGTVTTTTTAQVNQPYVDTANTLYLYTYDQDGHLCSQHSRTLSTRSGGDPYNSLGYNLTTLMFAINMRGRLMGEAVNAVVAGEPSCMQRPMAIPTSFQPAEDWLLWRPFEEKDVTPTEAELAKIPPCPLEQKWDKDSCK
jgi:hypothetical protein